jgi:NADPH:quinone reductase-like Zn-dependent oxidoreductase
MPPRLARTVWFERAGVAAVREEPLAEPKDGEVIVRGAFSGVSAGTERLVLGGRVPESVREVMALPSMRGSFALPIAYGYAWVGHVDGERAVPVFAMLPHADVAVVARASLRPMPAPIPATRLTLAANLETAVNVGWDAEIALGDRIVVLGLGVVGLLIARLASRAGAQVLAFDPDADRRALAAELDVSAAASAPASALREADAIIDATGSPAALQAAIDGAGPDARIVVASWHGDTPTPLALGGAFHARRLRIVSSQVGRLPPHRLARWNHDRRFGLVAGLLADPALDRLVAPPVPLSDAPRLYAELVAGARWSPPHRVFDLAR